MAKPSGRALTLIAIFGLIPLLNFPRALLSDRTLYARDIATVWAPQIEAVVDQVGRGEFPFFDDRRGFGQPLFADPRSEVLYPPAWLHWILPLDRSYTLFCALHLVIAALGSARLARRLWPGLSVPGQLTAGISYAAGGPLLSLVSNWHHLAAAALMPWIIEKAEWRAPEKPPWIALPLLVSLQVFAGSPDYTFTTLLLCFLRQVTRAAQSHRERTSWAAMFVLGVLMSSMQLLPSLAFARDAARDTYPIGWARSPLHHALTIETAVPVRIESWPLRPDARNTLFADGASWMFSHYLGLSVWILAILGASRAPLKECAFLMSAAGIGLVFAWGVTNEGMGRVIAQIPFVSGLRFPTKHLAATSLSLSLLAALGVQGLRDLPAKRRLLLMGLVGLASVLAGALYFLLTEPSSQLNLALLGRPLAAVACALAVLALAGRERTWHAIPALIAADLLIVHSAINPTTPATLFRTKPPLSASIPTGSRVYVSDYSVTLTNAQVREPLGTPYELARLPEGYSQSEGLSLAAMWYLNPPMAGRFGYRGSFDLDILDFYRAPLKKTVEEFVTSRDATFVLDRLRRASVSYVVTMDPPGLWDTLPLITQEALFFKTAVRVYGVPNTWPEVRHETTGGSLAEGTTQVLKKRNGTIELSTVTPARSLLVAAVANDSGWHATVDGRAVPIVDNTLAFASVALEPGPHRVTFSYRPPFFRVGLLVSLFATLAAIWLNATARGRAPAEP